MCRLSGREAAGRVSTLPDVLMALPKRFRDDLPVCPEEQRVPSASRCAFGDAVETPGLIDILPVASLPDNLHKRLELLIT